MSKSSEKVKPLSPEEVVDEKAKSTPNAVLSAWNDLITRNYKDGRAEISQTQAVAAIKHRMKCDSATCFREGWLDIEDVYRAAGWFVEYDKPGYNEDYEATFTFRKGADGG